MRHSFLLKLAGALLLVALADLLFWFQRVGSTLGLFALAVLVVTACTRIEMFARWPSRIAAAAALVFALALAADPGPLALLLFALAVTLAALLPRTARFDDGWRWALRLVVHGVLSAIGPFRDYLLLGRARRRRGPLGLRGKLPVLVLPLIGSIVFLTLFAQANPLIGDALARIDLLPEFDFPLALVHCVFWGIVFFAMWSLVRPPRFALWATGPALAQDAILPGVSIGSVAISLIAFNLIFALQNGLDLAFLWTGAALPDGMTFAEYAHRGAYPLIATALLAGLFVLVTLRPGAPTAASRPIRLLVTLWIVQNVLLVASTMLRTADYIAAYSLTVLRIAALIWMALVAVGLVLICLRLLRAKSGAWLINANLLAAGIVLAGCCWVDLGAIAAGWNARNAREVGGPGAALDLCYLHELGPSALPALVSLESRPLPAELRERVQWVRSRIVEQLARSRTIGTAGRSAAPAASRTPRPRPPLCACLSAVTKTGAATAGPTPRRRPSSCRTPSRRPMRRRRRNRPPRLRPRRRRRAGL